MSANELAGKQADDARRVALLARPGKAREQLRRALEEAGARIVLEDDPDTLQCLSLEQSAPQVVLVALDPGNEESLARFDSVLNDPAIAVIYDEAELAVRREGWEAQRWARHLRAKLNGHADVLPPGGEEEPAQPQPGMPASPAQLHAGAGIEMHLEEAHGRSAELPSGGLQPAAPEPLGLYQDMEPEAWQPPAGADAETPMQAAGQPAEETPARAPMALELELESEDAAAATGPVAEGHSGPRPRRGAMLMFAGIGGPDAVRKVLAELPAGLARPVLVQLRLDGGRYDNLVKQMARVSVLPVELAAAGGPAQPGRVYVVPTNVAMQVVDGVVHFAEGETDIEALMGALPASESAVLILSGSNAEDVDPAMTLGDKGAFVAGQLPQGCYDAVASKALAARGGMTGTPAELAARAAVHLGA